MDFKDKRFVDSGVWMASDESLPSEDAPAWGEDLIKSAREAGPLAMGMDPLRRQYQSASQPCSVFRKAEEPREYQLARAVVNDCLEKGQEKVDLRFVALCFEILRALTVCSVIAI